MAVEKTLGKQHVSWRIQLPLKNTAASSCGTSGDSYGCLFLFSSCEINLVQKLAIATLHHTKSVWNKGESQPIWRNGLLEEGEKQDRHFAELANWCHFSDNRTELTWTVSWVGTQQLSPKITEKDNINRESCWFCVTLWLFSYVAFSFNINGRCFYDCIAKYLNDQVQFHRCQFHHVTVTVGCPQNVIWIYITEDNYSWAIRRKGGFIIVFGLKILQFKKSLAIGLFYSPKKAR